MFCSFCVFHKSKSSSAATIVDTSKLHYIGMSFVIFDERIDIFGHISVFREPPRKNMYRTAAAPDHILSVLSKDVLQIRLSV